MFQKILSVLLAATLCLSAAPIAPAATKSTRWSTTPPGVR